MSDDDKFSAEKLAHPEWYTYGTRSERGNVLWIVDSGLGDTPIHLVYVGLDGQPHNTNAPRNANWIFYTAPDPWEGVELPEVFIDTTDKMKVMDTYVYVGGVPPGLPHRKFKLVPL